MSIAKYIHLAWVKRWRPLLILSFYFGLIVIVVGCSSHQDQADKKNMVRTQKLPHDSYSAPLYRASKKADAKDFKTLLLGGKFFYLSRQKGKVVVLNIWATWCPPCREETPDLIKVYKKYQHKNVEFLGISIDEQGKSVVKPFVKKYEVPYPITIDDGTIMDKYGPVMGVPTTYIIDQQGRVRYFATGAITPEELEPRLKKLLSEENETADRVK